MAQNKFVAVDLGASNGRLMLGKFDGSKIRLQEMNRFANNYICVNEAYYWDILHLYSNILDGLKSLAEPERAALSGIGIDTWGVDFGLLDKQGNLLGNPRSYRDPRGERGMRAFHKKYGEDTAFKNTGIANLSFNTVYQLYDMVQTQDPILSVADRLLLIPDLLGYMLCGEKSIEYTNATTTQMLGLDSNWSTELLKKIGVPESLMGNIRYSGETKGQLHEKLAQEIGFKKAPSIFCVGSHDTASAVASIPACENNFAFLSSGTWSLMGIISDHAIINDKVYRNKFSNEGTTDRKYRPLQNIMGLWIIQNCKKNWEKEEALSWENIVQMADKAQPFQSYIDVNAPRFFEGENMPQKIQQYCGETGQIIPQTKGEIARIIFESLAMSYRKAFLRLEKLMGRNIDVLYIVGGGANNHLLNQMTANSICKHVVAGPVEATAIGNLMMQLKAAKEVKDMAEIREVICNSFAVENFDPQRPQRWTEEFIRYQKIIGDFQE